MTSKHSQDAKHPPSADFDDDDILVGADADSMDTVDEEDSKSVESLKLAKKETKVVTAFRVILLLVLLVVAVAVSLTAYFMTLNGEENDFHDTYEIYASKVSTSWENEAQEKLVALISLSVALTSHAQFANETWPFVTLSDFEAKASLVRDLAHIMGLMVLPLVTNENVKAWSEYSSSNQGWYWEGLHMQEQKFGSNFTNGTKESDLNITGDIHQFNDTGLANLTEDSQGPFFPIWQYSPQVPLPLANTDFRSLPDATKELNSFLEDDTRRNVVGPFFESTEGSSGEEFMDLLFERIRKGGYEYSDGPVSYYYLPVYETQEEGSPLVAIVVAFIYWEAYFKDLLPENVNGVITVLENSCGQSSTFIINGAEADFVGNGDLHDISYDHLEVATPYGAFTQRSPDVDLGGCFYRTRVYPSKELEDSFMTNAPLTICLAMMGVFVFTAVVFLAYDRFVEKRQRVVMKSAAQTSEVVSKLFPETVRDRLYEMEPKNSTVRAKDVLSTGNQSLISSVLRTGGSDATSSAVERLHGAGKPIADEYLHCTVFFADLAGFTKWSSKRTPTEVFTLLETLYGNFDKIARRLGVFKIETIGDCYVAVTGLPIPQERHAVIMTRFAASTMHKMNQLVNSDPTLLSLGEGTNELQLRVGLHSGPVTAGVLRGEKARFQLFGDTVNTAARMESNGIKGRIQVSQTTADLLIAAGKQQWVSAREDLIEAKGKGKMQTYWVEICTDQSVRTSTMTGSVSEFPFDDTEVGGTAGLLQKDSNAIPVYEWMIDV